MEINAENRISQRDADKLIAAHDGDVALLYLYILRHGFDLDGAARELCRTGADIAAAAEKLRRMGLADAAQSPAPPQQAKLPPADELPEYTADDITRRTREDGSFRAVVAETQRVLGHTLSGPDMKLLFGMYDYLALPPEVILELLNFCVDRSREKYGTGRLPSMRSIEKEAFVWVNREILTWSRPKNISKPARPGARTWPRPPPSWAYAGGNSPPRSRNISANGWTWASAGRSSPPPTTAP
jgi:hypothetical protein